MISIAAFACASDTNATKKKEKWEIEVDTAIFMRQAKELQEILVRPKKEKYSKKNNLAVELMQRVRAYQKNGDPALKDNYSFDQYDKTTLGLLDFSDKELKRHPFLNDYIDTTRYGSRPVLSVLMKEKNATQLYSEAKKKHKTVVMGRSSSGMDDAFDDGNINTMLEEILREVDIYGNDITLMANRFVSPLSSIGADYYKYFITDTLDVDGTKCIQLTFSPHNPESFSFMGNLYVELGDTTGFVKKVSMKVPRTINLNYVDNLYIDQIFEKDSLGKRHKVLDEMNVDLCIIKGTQPFYSRRVTRYSNFSYEKRKDLSKAYDMLGDIWEIDADGNNSGGFGSIQRMESLSKAEANMGTFMTRIREVPLFYWAEKVLVILVNGYIKTGKPSKFDIGPVNTLISANTIEGVRLRLGGMTTANLSPHWFARGYVAYGTRDEKWKYKGELEYSFNKKKYHSREFPVNSIRATYMYDLDMLGQHYLFTNADNIFLSWKRRPSNLGTYRQLAKIEYNLELASQFSFSIWGERIKQEATIWLPFKNGMGRSISHYSRMGFGVTLRYAPGEKFVQEKSVRVQINLDAPIFQLTHEWGPKGLLGSDFTTNKTELSIQKRFWFSAFGYTDIILKGGIIWSQVQYPELMWPNANLSYTIQPESYSLMNPMEFAMDKYTSLDVTYWGNGVLFNRLPLIKKAKLREVISFKGIYGGISNRNRPELNKNLFLFPSDSYTRYMGRKPYMEISAGIDNIFTILRVDYIWRLSYRDTPGADRSGLRIALHFTF
ncbi:MAG: DUF5686 family protein [Muribaculum sp.]|nr:DUF5686 family protein [Muribaculum sp.]